MRHIILALFATLFLSSCQSLYDDAARDECSQLPSSRQMDCRDAVDRNRRERGD